MPLRFHHWSERETAYQALLIADRTPMHRAAAECLESSGDLAALADDTLFDLAETAFTGLGSEVSVPRELSRHWESSGRPRRGGLCALLASLALERRDRYVDSLDDARRAERLLTECGDARSAATANAVVGHVLTRTGRFGAAIEAFSSALEAGDPSSPAASPSIRSRVLARRAFACSRIGRGDEARRDAEEALDLAEAAGVVPVLAAATSTLGVVEAESGHFDRSTELLERTRELWRSIGDLRGEATSILNFGSLKNRRGDQQAAAEAMESALAIQRRVGDRFGAAVTFGNIGTIRMVRGECENAREAFVGSLSIRSALGDRYGQSWCLMQLAELDRLQGRFHSGLEHANRAREVLADLDDPTSRSAVDSYRSQLAALRGDRREALVGLRRALRYERERGERPVYVWHTYMVGCVLVWLGRTRAAAWWLRRAAEAATRIGAADMAAEAFSRLALCLADLAAPGAAEATNAARDARRSGDPGFDATVLPDLARARLDGDAAAARAISERARSLGLRLIACDALLAAAAIERAAGSEPVSAREAEALAREIGALSIAARASRLSRGPR